RAVALGLATEVADEPFVAATRWLEQVATRSPDAVAATKALFERTWSSGPRRTFARERFAQARLLAGANAAVARKAALARRQPQFGPRAH
ncbi:MAG: crotonase/enoyl-CoA hydratase family protein, partial [Dermatophilaceae bacterium]